MSAKTEDTDGDDHREDRPWPKEEDCPGCDGHKDKGPHRFGCSVHGARQPKFYAVETETGRFMITSPNLSVTPKGRP